MQEAIDLLAPPLDQSEQVYLQQLTELTASVLGECTAYGVLDCTTGVTYGG